MAASDQADREKWNSFTPLFPSQGALNSLFIVWLSAWPICRPVAGRIAQAASFQPVGTRFV